MDKSVKYNLQEVIGSFRPDCGYVSGEVNGCGHINDTFRVTVREAGGAQRLYTVQRINHHVFKKPWEVMENITRVTSYLSEKIRACGGDPTRGTLHFLQASDGKSFHVDAEGNYWRCYDYVDGARTYQILEGEGMFYNVGTAFGRFQRFLSDYPADSLHETIPLFHHTRNRMKNFREALAADVCGRAKEVEYEIGEILRREADTSLLVDMLEKGTLPLKVTHNDTKVNNVLIDDETKQGICVIDLDTVMPGLAAYDFGDAVRVGASTAEEDERDLEKVNFDLALYEAFARGFIDGTGGLLSSDEIDSLPVGARMMTFENGIRFLTDYLSGDTYFKISCPDHNLVRCRTQLRMLAHMEAAADRMLEVVRNAAATK